MSTSTSVSESKSRLVLRPRSGWLAIDWAEIWRYRDLFVFLVRRDIKILYKQTVLGFAWAIVRPVFGMLVFSVIFGGLATMPSDGVPYPIFSYAALLPWTYASTAINTSTSSVVSSSHLLTKIYFPRLVIPLAPVITGLLDLAIASVILALMMVYYRMPVTPEILVLPLLVLIMMLYASGVGMMLSAMAVRYRDVKHAMTFLMQLLMYAAPVVWPLSLITEKLPEHGETVRLLYATYPMVGVIEGFRAALLGTQPVPWDIIAIGAASSALMFVFGAFYFRRSEPHFADVV